MHLRKFTVHFYDHLFSSDMRVSKLTVLIAVTAVIQAFTSVFFRAPALGIFRQRHPAALTVFRLSYHTKPVYPRQLNCKRLRQITHAF